jgi:hypothetical protein
MLLLFETAAGYALFKVVKEGKLEKAEVRTARALAAALGRVRHVPTRAIPRERPLPVQGPQTGPGRR